MSQSFKQRGYDETLIDQAVEKAYKITTKPYTETLRVTFVSEYSSTSK